MKGSFARFVGIVLGFGLCFSPAYAVTLPFSSTYDCAEQAEGSQGWVTCDGIGPYGGWTTANGNGEQITSAANNPGGGGGRGQRHWIGQSSGNTNGSGSTGFSFPRVQEIYVRWYVRWQAGLRLGGDTPPGSTRNHKVIYFTGSGCGTSTQGCYFDLKGGSFAFVQSGFPYDQGTGWDGLFGGSGYSTQSDGRWIMFEIHLKIATGGQNNGVAQWWVDGVLKLDVNNVNFSGSNGFTGFTLPENAQFTTVGGACCDMYEDIDDVAISTTGPIGPVGGTSPISAPTNLRVQ